MGVIKLFLCFTFTVAGIVGTFAAHAREDEWKVKYSETDKAREEIARLNLSNANDWADALVDSIEKKKREHTRLLLTQRKSFKDFPTALVSNGECLASALVGKNATKQLETLLKDGLNPDCEFVPNKPRPLWLALIGQHLKESQLLLKYGADTGFYYRSSTETYWRELVRKKHENFAKKLFSTKELIEKTDSAGLSFFSAAAVWGAENLIRHALDKGADPAKPALGAGDHFGLSLLNNQFEVATLLTRSVRTEYLKKFRDENDNSYLHWCAELGKTDLCSALAEVGLSVDAINAEALTPIDLAGARGFNRTAKALSKFSGNQNERELLYESVQAGDCRYLNSFLKRKSRHHAEKLLSQTLWDRAGNTLLHSAAASGSGFCVKRLLKFGSAVGAINKYGQTPLHLSVLGDHLQVTKILLKASADPSDIDYNGNSPMHTAARDGLESQIEAMYGKGAYSKYIIYIKDAQGRTPMHIATLHKQYGVMRTILKLNAVYADTKDDFGLTAREIAKKNGDTVAIVLLEN